MMWPFKKKKSWDEKYLEFMTNLCDSEEPIISRDGWSSGYLYQMTVMFKVARIHVQIEYNYVRKSIEIETWSFEAQEFLFYYDCTDRKPKKTIAYFMNRYELWTMINEVVEIKDRNIKEQKIAKNKVLKRFLP